MDKLDRVFRWIGTAIFGTLALLIIGYIVLFQVSALWIKYRPIPLLPTRHVEYTVADTGQSLTGYFSLDTRDLRRTNVNSKTYYRLSEAGTVAVLSYDDGERDMTRREAMRAQVAKQLRVEHTESRDRVVGVSQTGNVVLLRIKGRQRVGRGGKPGTILSRELQGYDWERYCRSAYFAVNGRGDVIGNELLATGCASSGGMSESHGRRFPVLWHGDHRLPEDMNTLISATEGWYLYGALDINELGQVLCIADKRSVRDAESGSPKMRLVVLTPMSALRSLK